MLQAKCIVTTDVGKRPIFIVPVVNPDGVIKYVRVNQYVQSPLVHITLRHAKAKTADEVDVQLKVGLENKGWALLADEFVRDNKAAAWPHFLKWMTDGPMGTPGATVPAWPAKYTPRGVREREQRQAAHQQVYEIKVPELDASDDRVSPRGGARGA